MNPVGRPPLVSSRSSSTVARGAAAALAARSSSAFSRGASAVLAARSSSAFSRGESAVLAARSSSAFSRGASAVLAGALGLVLLLAGCAGNVPTPYAAEPGVTVRVTLASGESFSGTLVGMEADGLLIDHSVPKSPRLEVVRKGGTDIVYVDGVPVGRAVEVRGVDVLVRQRFTFFDVQDVSVVSRAYLGWGTVVAAVLAFLLVELVRRDS